MKEKQFTKHAIQLEKIIVNEASFKLTEYSGQLVLPNPKFLIGKSEYDKQNHLVSIGFMVKIEGDQFNYTCTIEIVGLFSVDENKFDISKIDDWGDKNAPFILLPYLRQYLFNLTIMFSGEGFTLPLVEVPTSGTPISEN